MADERTLEWARERWANTVRLAALKTGSDREGWLADGRYWLAIVEQLAANDGLRATVSRLTQERDKAQFSVKDLTAQWSIMARACGNYRDFGMALTPEVIERRRLIDDVDYQVATRAILERDELRAEHLRLTQALHEKEKGDRSGDEINRHMPSESGGRRADLCAQGAGQAGPAGGSGMGEAGASARDSFHAEDGRGAGAGGSHGGVAEAEITRLTQALQESQAAVKQLAGDVRAVNAANVEVETALQEAQERWDHWHGEALGLLNERNELRSSLTRQSEGLARLLAEFRQAGAVQFGPFGGGILWCVERLTALVSPEVQKS